MKKLLHQANHLLLLLAIATISGATSLRAQSLDVNFYSAQFGGATATGAGVVGGPSDVWNGINGDGGVTAGPFSLVNTAGGATPVTLSYSLNNNAGIGAITSLAQNTQQNPSLMNDYLFNNVGGSINVAIGGLSDNTTYDLYLYLASNDGNSSARAASVTANAAAGVVTGNPDPTFTAGDDYLLLQAISSATGTINITELNPGNASGEVDMNGLQIRAVPDASATLSLLPISLAALAIARRKIASATALS